MFKRHLLALALATCAAPAFAQHAKSAPVDPTIRKAVIAALSTQLKSNYVFTEVAATLVVALTAREASGAYASANDSDAFAKLLSTDMRKLGKDGHFNVEYDPQFHAPPPGAAPLPDAAEIERGRQEMAQYGYGVDSLARLPGNVGYLEVRGFGPTELVGQELSAAMSLLQGTDALILDLRRNGGGEPHTVAHLMSHFFGIGDQRHLNDIYSRTDASTHQYWTDPTVMPRYTKPVYVLTSARTFSGGEECAYDFQTQKRATLVGQTTGGGANPGDVYAIGHGFAAFIPNGRSINPVTHANWEHVGVKPDIATSAADAKQTAYAMILRTLVADAEDPERRTELQETLHKVETGAVDAPNYAARH